jgi:fluoride ion exporter CrcB/FEX
MASGRDRPRLHRRVPTFSTFAQDLYGLTTARQYAEATLDLTASVIAGVLAVVAGTAVGKAL